MVIKKELIFWQNVITARLYSSSELATKKQNYKDTKIELIMATPVTKENADSITVVTLRRTYYITVTR